MTSLVREESHWPELYRHRRAILVVDVVESVRLMHEHESEVINRWLRFVHEARTNILPRHGGRLVKSLGDGMLIDFDSALGAVRSALDMHQHMAQINQGLDRNDTMLLRAGVHECEIVVGDTDIYGDGVNLASRLSTLAGPGETILSPEARDAVVVGLDVDVEDLGDCFLKHYPMPQRAYRAGPVGQRSVIWSGAAARNTSRACIAVIPFAEAGPTSNQNMLGEIIADDLIAQLSRSRHLNVVSRLSTTRLRQPDYGLAATRQGLGCHFLVSGSCALVGGSFLLRAELVDCKTEDVIWADALRGQVDEVLAGTSPLVDALTQQVCHALLGAELQRAVTLPLPSLQSYSILLGAIALMHRLSPRDFERARTMLSYLVDRHPRATAPQAWLGKWHVMRVAQGWSPNRQQDAAAARAILSRALDHDPDNSLALSIDGLVCSYINKDLAQASQRYEAALHANPNESLAWLFVSGLRSYQGQGQLAIEAAQQAQRLSPLDPMKYYFDHFSAVAMLSADDFPGAILMGQRSLRANRTHGPTLRSLAVAQVLNGNLEEARTTVSEILRLEPDFSVTRFFERYPGDRTAQARKYADALHAAGLPN